MKLSDEIRRSKGYADFDVNELADRVAQLEEMVIVGPSRAEAENAALKRENEAWRQAGEDAIKQLGTIVGLMSITALLTAEESE